MEKTFYWIWLSILNLSQIQKIKLLEIFKKPQKIYELSKKELEEIITSQKLIDIITSKETKEEAKNILQQTEKKDIEIITIENDIYPENLKRICNYPFVIYAKGNIELLKERKIIAIVGSRNNSEYGKTITTKFSYLLARKNYCIISGLAKGIDSYAHKGALIAKGETIAVLGSGIEYIYPKENEKLYNEILIKNGLIISEYPLLTKPRPEYFPYRNRIISGLSEKVLVTEAKQKSGSIITATLALEQGKDVYAIPGNITNKNSSGTNNLIKDGAFLVSSLEDIIDL